MVRGGWQVNTRAVSERLRDVALESAILRYVTLLYLLYF